MYIFSNKDYIEQFRTHILEYFKKTIDYFIQNDKSALNNPNFIYNSNVLDIISNGTSNYVIQLYLITKIHFKYISVEF